jgi:hypothetical protein
MVGEGGVIEKAYQKVWAHYEQYGIPWRRPLLLECSLWSGLAEQTPVAVAEPGLAGQSRLELP